MTSAYRDNAAEAQDESERMHDEIVNGGRLHRKTETGHNCKVPGLLSRLWNEIRLGDEWECVCGATWKWTKWENAPDMGHEVGLCSDCWVHKTRCKR